MKNLKYCLLIPTMLGVLFAASASAQSASNDELTASRVLIAALERENAALRSRLETERSATALLTELYAARSAETEALRAALAAKNDALDARSAVIAAQERLIAELKKRRMPLWKRIGDIAVGAAIGAVLR